MWQMMKSFETMSGIFLDTTDDPYEPGVWEMKKYFDEKSLECVRALEDALCAGHVKSKWRHGVKTFLWTSWYDLTKVVLDWNGKENTFRLRHSAKDKRGGIIMPWTSVESFSETAGIWYTQRTGRDWCEEMNESMIVWDKDDLEVLVNRKQTTACWRSIFSWQSYLRSRYIIQVPLRMSCVKDGRNVVIVGSAVDLDEDTSWSDGEEDEIAQRRRDREDGAKTCLQRMRWSAGMLRKMLLFPIALPFYAIGTVGCLVFYAWSWRRFRIRIDLNEIGLTHL